MGGPERVASPVPAVVHAEHLFEDPQVVGNAEGIAEILVRVEVVEVVESRPGDRGQVLPVGESTRNGLCELNPPMTVTLPIPARVSSAACPSRIRGRCGGWLWAGVATRPRFAQGGRSR